MTSIFSPDFYPFCILEKPVSIRIESVIPGTPYAVQKATDELLVFLHFDKKSLIKYSALALLVIPLLYLAIDKDSGEGPFAIGLIIIGMIISATLLLYSLTSNDRSIFFDRQNGLMSYSGFLWERLR